VWAHAATEVTWEMRIRAGLLWLGRDAAISGETSGRWLGLDGCTADAVEFLTPRARRSKDPRFELHTTSIWVPADITQHRGVRCTTATRTILDLAGRNLRAHRIEDAIDSAVRLRRTSLTQLTARINEPGLSHRRGVTLLRELLLDSGGESLLERRFLRLMRTTGLPRPTCQVMHRAGRGTAARVDFQFPGTQVVVEVSGRLGHTSNSDRRRDAHRRNLLQLGGLQVVEFTTADVIDDPSYVLSTVGEALDVTG